MLKGQKYGVILADPPWSWKSRSPKGDDRAASNHYSVMDLDAIKALPVAKLAATDCVLFMWAIDSMLPHAIDTIAAWGFKYKTVGFYWAKANKKSDTPFTGLGYWDAGQSRTMPPGYQGEPQATRRRCSEAGRLAPIGPFAQT